MKCTQRISMDGPKRIHLKIGMKVSHLILSVTVAILVVVLSSVTDHCPFFAGEIWFFDNYIIPLAKKLTECGVFGVSSDEYLQYAIENRREWEMKGKDVAAATLAKFLQRNQAKSVRSIVQPTDEETVASCP